MCWVGRWASTLLLLCLKCTFMLYMAWDRWIDIWMGCSISYWPLHLQWHGHNNDMLTFLSHCKITKFCNELAVVSDDRCDTLYSAGWISAVLGRRPTQTLCSDKSRSFWRTLLCQFASHSNAHRLSLFVCDFVLLTGCLFYWLISPLLDLHICLLLVNCQCNMPVLTYRIWNVWWIESIVKPGGRSLLKSKANTVAANKK